MPFEIWKNQTQLSQFGVLVALSPLSIIVVVLRFVATISAKRKPSWEDWFAVLATMFFILTNVAGLNAIGILNGRSIVQEIQESPLDYKHMRQWDMAGLYFYFFHSLTVKLSVLALYHRIFQVNKAYRIWIYVLAGLQASTTIIFSILTPLTCKPFERYFDRSIPGNCTDDGLTVLAGETPNSLIDFAMVVLAMFMIRPLQLASAMKWRLRILFGLGSLVGLLGFVKIAITYSASDLYAFSLVSLWSAVQGFFAVLCCCLPVYYPILPTAASLGKIPTRIRGYAHFSRTSGSQSIENTKSKRSASKRSGNSCGSEAAVYYDDFPVYRPEPPHNHPGWGHELPDDSSSTKNLTWPHATLVAETHAMQDYSPRQQTPNSAFSELSAERRFELGEPSPL